MISEVDGLHSPGYYSMVMRTPASGAGFAQRPKLTCGTGLSFMQSAAFREGGPWFIYCRQFSPDGGSQSPLADHHRRGVLLLIALIVLTLFMLLGTTYMVVATKRRVCTVTIGSAGAQTVTAGKDAVDTTLGDVLVGDPSNGSSRDGVGPTARARISKYFVSSILSDKYGDRYDTMNLTSGSSIPSNVVNVPSGFFAFTLSATAAQQIGAPYAGRIVALDETKAVFRIIASSSSGSNHTFIAHPVNPAATITLTGSSPSINKPAYIQGREFTGDASDPNDLHESYDAPDGRNWFLSWVQTDAILGRNQIPGDADDPADGWKYVVPSFHRPDRLLGKLKELKSSGTAYYTAWTDTSAIMLMRPAGRMTFDPATNWAALGFDSLPPMVSGTALEHPNFTGSNERIVNGTRCYFDPINGPWDVDNDGDGVTDSIWLDVGMPTVKLGPTETPCKPLVALLITDLDSRINVNAHGSNAKNLFGTSPFALNSGTSTGIYYAGTSLSGTAADGSPAPRRASLSRGQGWGVAEIDLSHAFATGGPVLHQGLLSGTATTGAGSTPRGTILPNIKAEGRYGDSVAITGPLAPAPGRLNVADPSVDDAPATEPRDKHIPDKFGTPTPGDTRRHTAGSPVDVWGNLQIGIDQMGQPFFSRYTSTSGSGWPLTWSNDRIDDPYDLSLSRTAPRPGWSYDPVVSATSTTPSSLQDNLFSAAHLERLLRLFEPSSPRLSPRLASFFGANAELARLTATTDSWDSTAACMPLKVLKPLLDLSDQMDASKPSLVSWDLQMGLRMDINRPFGDGLDNSDPAYPGFGVADEPGEEVPETSVTDVQQQMLRKGLTNGRDVDGNNTVDASDQKIVRQLFARHLFVLAMKTAPASLVGAALTAFRKEAAQWAVNVVDYRDPDSIMTRLRYDDTFDRSSSTWQITIDSPEVWGCERPETLITEVIAWRNVTEVGHGTPINDWTWNDTKTGGFMVELYNPWTSETDAGVRGNRLPVELMQHNSLNESKGYSKAHVIDLAKLSRNESQDVGWPVFQLVVVKETQGNRDKLLNDPTWPRHESSTTGTNAGNSTSDIERVSYLGPRSNKLHKDRYGQMFGLTTAPSSQPQGDATTLSPGQCAVVAGPIVTDPTKTDNMILSIMTTSTNQSQGVLMALADINEGGQDLGFSDSQNKLPFKLTAGLSELIEGDGTQANPPPQNISQRQTARTFPKDAGFGPVGAMICVTSATGAEPLRMPPHLGSSYNTLQVVSDDGAYRVLLRRLANPLEHYHRDDNPYITIDSAVFNEQCLIHGSESSPSDTATMTLGSTERGDSAPHSSNNLWKQSDADLNASTCTYQARGASTGARKYCGRVNPSTTIRWTMGFLPSKLRIPGPGIEDTPPFPWFPWLNRDFASVHELLLVPKSSPSTLLRQHSHKWPFEHLFFGGGAADALVDPSDRLGILEFLTVPSRFADAEQRIDPNNAAALSQFMEGQGGRPLFLPPHNYLSPFREPGRININTLSSKVVWEAMNGGRPGTPYEDEVRYDDDGSPQTFKRSEDWGPVVSYATSANWAVDSEEDGNANGILDRNDDDNNDGQQTVSGSAVISGTSAEALRSIAASRRGWAIPSAANPATKIAGQFDRITNRTHITSGTNPWFESPFQSGWTVVSGTPSQQSYKPSRSIFMREAVPAIYTSGSNAKRPEFLFSSNLNNSSLQRADGSQLRGFPYNDPERNPYFHFRDIIRLSNLTTPRSNVFAVWVTVGYFTIETTGTRQTLGAEYGLETGDVVRPKAFSIIDRSIPIGFRPGDSSRVSDLQLLYRFNN
jgi:hypothetical protein